MTFYIDLYINCIARRMPKYIVPKYSYQNPCVFFYSVDGVLFNAHYFIQFFHSTIHQSWYAM